MNTQKKSRRKFVRGAATAAALGAVPLEPFLGGKESRAEASVTGYNSANRAAASFQSRHDAAVSEKIGIGVLPDNGDSARFADHSAVWHKAILHDDLEMVNQNAWTTFTEALNSGKFSDFQNIIVGSPGTGTLNGPMSSYAFDLEGLDSYA